MRSDRRALPAVLAAAVGLGLLPAVALVTASPAAAAVDGVRITEWEYNGSEFAEFTNLGPSTVDMTGWAFDDSDPLQGTVDLSAFGEVAVGESVLLTESPAETFRTAWNLGPSVKIIGGNIQN